MINEVVYSPGRVVVPVVVSQCAPPLVRLGLGWSVPLSNSACRESCLQHGGTNKHPPQLNQASESRTRTIDHEDE